MNLNESIDKLLEGGTAMDASRISVENIKATFDRYKEQVIKKIDPQAKYKTIGSLGKKPSSGDIDVAIKSEFSLDQISDKLKNLGIEHQVQKGLKQIYTKFPIYNPDGSKTGNDVQVDLMFGDPDLLVSTYWTPGEGKSKYSGADLAILFSGITRFTPIKNIQDSENKKRLQELKKEKDDIKISYVYDVNKGIFIKARWKEEITRGKNKGKMKEKSERLPNPVATSIDEIVDLWNTDSNIKWNREDFFKPLEKVWKKAKKAFSTNKLRNIIDYSTNSLSGPKLESSVMRIFKELL